MRARWLKPEAFHDRKLAKLGANTFVVYQALRCLADDSGVAQADADLVHGKLFFRSATIGLHEITCSITELHNAGLIVLYMVGDDTFAEIPEWNEKEIANPSKFRHPKRAEGVVLKRLTDESGDKATGALQKGNCSPHILESYSPRILESQTPNACVVNESNDAPADDAPDEAAEKLARIDSDFGECWAIYPKRGGGNSRHDALKAYRARRRAGESHAVLLAGTERYLAFIQATGREGTEYVKQGSAFYGPSKHYLEAWEVPSARPQQNRRLTPGEVTKQNIDAMLGKGKS